MVSRMSGYQQMTWSPVVGHAVWVAMVVSPDKLGITGSDVDLFQVDHMDPAL